MSLSTNFSVSRLPKAKNADPDLLQYNATIMNRGTKDTGSAGDPPARFNETRASALITDISKQYFSIVRFSMTAGKNLPLFIPLIEVGQSDINKTIQRATIEASFDYDFGGGTGVLPFTQVANGGQAAPNDRNWIEWAPEEQPSSGVRTPSAPTATQDWNTEYQWGQTQDHFTGLLNDLLELLMGEIQVAFQAFQTANGGVGPAPALTIQSPKFFQDPTTKLFSVQFDREGFGDLDTMASDGDFTNMSFRLNFNQSLFKLQDNFENLQYGEDAIDKSNQFVVRNKLGTNLQEPPTGLSLKDCLVIEQNQKSIDTLWSPIESIVFTTSLIPVVPEQTGEPVVLNDANTASKTSAAAFTPIITDITLPLDGAQDYRQFIEYAPSAEQRFASMTDSKQEVRNIDVQVFWKNRQTGNLYPVRMPQGSTISMKMMFRTKAFGGEGKD